MELLGDLSVLPGVVGPPAYVASGGLRFGYQLDWTTGRWRDQKSRIKKRWEAVTTAAVAATTATVHTVVATAVDANLSPVLRAPRPTAPASQIRRAREQSRGRDADPASQIRRENPRSRESPIELQRESESQN